MLGSTVSSYERLIFYRFDGYFKLIYRIINY